MQYAFTPAVHVFLAVLFPNAVWGVLGPFPQKLKLCVQLATELQEWLVFGVRETAQHFRAFAAQEEDPSSLPNTHKVANNHLLLQFEKIQHPFSTSTGI